MFRNKVQPIPPVMPREIKIQKKSSKVIKRIILSIFILIVGAGVWLGYVANSAINKITDDNGNKSSLLSFLGDYNSSNIKGRAQGRTNILILGMGGSNHPGGTLSDTMIVLSVDYSNNKVGLISIPRDLWVPIPGFSSAKINEAYADGEKNKSTTGGGGALASRTVENILGIPIHYYLKIDFEGFKKIVDEVGGVDIYVDKALYDPLYPAADMIHYDPFSISVGNHHMDGATALKYARSRETTSDFDRSRRQEQVMSAVKEKLFSLGFLSNPKKLTDLMAILGDHVRTNMQADEMRAFYEEIKNIDTTNMINKVLDTTVGGPLLDSSDSRGYYIYPRKGIANFSELQQIAKNLFQAEPTDITSIKVAVLNGSGKTGVATTVGKTLESYGYNITKVANATKLSAKTTVSDCTGKNAIEAVNIASKVQTGITIGRTCSQSGVDIEVIVGQDYTKR